MYGARSHWGDYRGAHALHTLLPGPTINKHSDVSSPPSLRTLLTERALGSSKPAINAAQNSGVRQGHLHANPPFFVFFLFPTSITL